jgi:hypothetical protein
MWWVWWAIAAASFLLGVLYVFVSSTVRGASGEDALGAVAALPTDQFQARRVVPRKSASAQHPSRHPRCQRLCAHNYTRCHAQGSRAQREAVLQKRMALTIEQKRKAYLEKAATKDGKAQ